MNGSDERRLWDVVVLQPVTFRVLANDEEEAKRFAFDSDLAHHAAAALGTCYGFPESVTVTEVVLEEADEAGNKA